MLTRVLLVLLAGLVGQAAAGTEDLKTLIQNKIFMNEEVTQFFSNALENENGAIDCSQGQNLYCPLASIPNVTFTVNGGTMQTSAGSCCPRNYLACQIQLNQQFCRTLGYYTIPTTTGNNEEKCPATTPACTCQQSLSGESNLQLRFCPATSPCCPNCECYGDPHCRAFDSSSEVWAVCDSRDATCLHNPTTCAAKNFGGQPCKWVKSGLVSYCARADNVTAPNMLMYSKSYKKYFTPSDNNVYQLSVILTLGTYGSISRVDVTDTGASAQPYTWFIDSHGNCKANSAYPFIKNVATVKNLPSMVSMDLLCTPSGGKSPTSGRIDVLHMEDPWFSQGGPAFGGYCATGVINEATGELLGTACNTVDRLITNYLGCKTTTSINTCKTNWCSGNYYKLDYTNIGSPSTTVAQKKRLCTQFVTDANPLKIKNFLSSVCSTSDAIAQGNFPQDPTQCASQNNCRACMDNILDFPEEIPTILAGAAATLSPSASCPDLLTIGLARRQLGVSQSGIQIDYQSPVTSLWTPVFALFDSEIAACNCETLQVNGTELANRALVTPGTYRIKQCNGLNTDPSQNMCDSSPAYNASVVYSNPIVGAVFSEPYGQLFSQSKLVCNPKVYLGCPPNYSCCVWGTSKVGWTDCMVAAYGPTFPIMYPNCKFPGV